MAAVQEIVKSNLADAVTLCIACSIVFRRVEIIKFDVSHHLLDLGIHQSCIDHLLFVLIDLCLAGCPHHSYVDNILLDPRWVCRIILSKPVEGRLHESVNIVDGIVEELDGWCVSSVSNTAVAVDATLGRGLVALAAHLLHGGGTLAAASFVLQATLSRGLVALAAHLLHGGGTLTAASFVLDV